MEAVLNSARAAELWAALKAALAAGQERGGLFAFSVEDGDLILRYSGGEAPAFSIHDDGCLYARF